MRGPNPYWDGSLGHRPEEIHFVSGDPERPAQRRCGVESLPHAASPVIFAFGARAFSSIPSPLCRKYYCRLSGPHTIRPRVGGMDWGHALYHRFQRVAQRAGAGTALTLSSSPSCVPR